MSKNVALSYEGACHRCGMPGHIARNCPQPRICTKCGMGGHVAKFCGQKQLTAKDKMLAKYSEVCHRCGNKGHMARECSSVAFKCRICGEDHHQSECPKNTGTLENMMKRKTYETSEFAKQKLAAEVAEKTRRLERVIASGGAGGSGGPGVGGGVDWEGERGRGAV